MEHVRLLLAIGLSFLVLFVWSIFFVDRQTGTDRPAPLEREKWTSEEQLPPAAEGSIRGPAGGQDLGDAVAASQSNEKPLRYVTVETPLYIVELSSKGASLQSFILKNYRESVDPDAPFKELVSAGLTNGVIRTSLADSSLAGLDDAVFSIDQNIDRLPVRGSAQSLNFQWVSEDGVVFIKTYSFDPDSYLIDLKVTIKNNSNRYLNDQLVLSVRNGIGDDTGYAFVGPSALINNKLEQIKTKKINDQAEYKGNIKWIGIEDRYFISSIIPGNEVSGVVKLAIENQLVENQLVNPVFELSPGEWTSFEFHLFMGPKSMQVLNNLGHDFDKALNFGFFNFIAKPCLWFMNKIYSVIPNYGIAIILLTLSTKILLWPLGTKSYKSMSEMKKLQPLMTEIRDKYKNDKQKMNQELMALYRTYKVNPLGGCLPMVLQIPVFFALYRMLYQAIELRHAPFFLWITDLSAPERLFDFGFSIPFMEPPYGIPVLTIIMGATMLLQQKMSPPPGDPTQAKIMMLMPIVFTFIFINFSAGLVLYWLVNNVLSISQQYYVQKKTL